MANHGYVRTKKEMTRELVRDVFNQANEKYFFGLMQIEDDGDDTDSPFWTLYFTDTGDKSRSCRQCWINDAHNFEISHGGGGAQFWWWIDSLIQDEISRAFDGRVSDDGIGNGFRRKTWKTPLDFISYVKQERAENRAADKDAWAKGNILLCRMMMVGASKAYLRKLKNPQNSVDKR